MLLAGFASLSAEADKIVIKPRNARFGNSSAVSEWEWSKRGEGDHHLVDLAVVGGAKAIVRRNLRDLERMDLRFPALKLMTSEDRLRGLRK